MGKKQLLGHFDVTREISITRPTDDGYGRLKVVTGAENVGVELLADVEKIIDQVRYKIRRGQNSVQAMRGGIVAKVICKKP